MRRPPRPVVLGTAGHIDHGKTSLVHALSGIDTDRLPEEKRRGITIELGFAPWQPDPSLHVSIIDVPGHEQFVRTMVAGAGAIDLVLLVVSAEEGVMPQTREHLNVCQLLGISNAIVALTQVDRLRDDAEALALAHDDVQEILDTTPFVSAPIVPCSAKTGEGIDDLRAALVNCMRALPRRDDRSDPILCLDRVFSLKGHGTVVTGTLQQGTLDMEDSASVHLWGQSPGQQRREIRVRSLQIAGTAHTRATAGQRVALNLVGVTTDEVHRGDVITRGTTVRSHAACFATVTHLAGDRQPWRAGTTLQICVGTAHTIARLDPWPPHDAHAGATTIPPKTTGLCLLRLQRALPLWRGATVILRAFSDRCRDRSGLTLGGGKICDPAPAMAMARRARSRWGELASALQHPDPVVRAHHLIENAGGHGLQWQEIAQRTQLADRARLDTRTVMLLARDRVVDAAAVRALAEDAVAQVDTFHATSPRQAGIARATLEASWPATTAPDVARAAVDLAIQRGDLCRTDDHRGVCRPGRGMNRDVPLPPPMAQIFALYEKAGSTPPTVREVATASGLNHRDVLEIISALQRLGHLVRVTPDLSFEAKAHRRLLDLAQTELLHAGTLDVQRIKALTGLSRKFAVPLLEHLDDLGITLRRGNIRHRGIRCR